MSDLSAWTQSVCGVKQMLLGSLTCGLLYVSKIADLLACGSCSAWPSLIFGERLICVLVLLNFTVFLQREK